MPATHNEAADLLELCRQPTNPGDDYWPTADNWTQTKYARDRNGNPVPSISEDAISWCAIGRLLTTAYRHHNITEPHDVTNAALHLLQNTAAQDDTDIIDWHDQPGRTPQQIAQAFTATIAAARQEGDRHVPMPADQQLP